MADIFYSEDAINLLNGKKIYFIGDSNIRALYKDVVCLLVHNRLLTEKQLREKAERTFLGDELLRGSALTKGRAYREDRRFRPKNLNVHAEFHFITRCLNEDIEWMMEDIRNKKITAPDVIVMNSTLWDVNRWGWNGVEKFKENMETLMKLFRETLPPSTLVIWVTAPPLSVEIRGGFMIKQIEYAKFTMRFHVMEANMFAHRLLSKNGYNVLDFHFHLRWQVHRRNPDGLHWTSKTMRHLTNLLLTHISLAVGVPLPGHFPACSLLERHKALALEATAADAAADAGRSCDFSDDVQVPDGPRAQLPLPNPELSQRALARPGPSSVTSSSSSSAGSSRSQVRPPPRVAVRPSSKITVVQGVGARPQHRQQGQGGKKNPVQPPQPHQSQTSWSAQGQGRARGAGRSGGHHGGVYYFGGEPDYSQDGPYFETQQIQPHYAPVRRQPRHADRRQRPY